MNKKLYLKINFLLKKRSEYSKSANTFESLEKN